MASTGQRGRGGGGGWGGRGRGRGGSGGGTGRGGHEYRTNNNSQSSSSVTSSSSSNVSRSEGGGARDGGGRRGRGEASHPNRRGGGGGRGGGGRGKRRGDGEDGGAAGAAAERVVQKLLAERKAKSAEDESEAGATKETAEMEVLVDIGPNLTNNRFKSDLDSILSRAMRVGVKAMILTGTSVGGSKDALTLAQLYSRPFASASSTSSSSSPDRPFLYCTAGVHPHDAKSCDASTISTLRSLAADPHVVAIGECGLDFDRNFSPAKVQEKVILAKELGKPLFLHERRATDAFLAILKRHQPLPKAVVHCFTGEERDLRQYLELDMHIGITGWICDPQRGRHLHRLVPLVPLNRLMIETDAPFLTPKNVADLPRRNEPAFLPFVLDTVAQCLKLSTAEVAAATTNTAIEFFGLHSCAEFLQSQQKQQRDDVTTST